MPMCFVRFIGTADPIACKRFSAGLPQAEETIRNLNATISLFMKFARDVNANTYATCR